MSARVDLRRLLDDVAMRASKIEIIVDARLEQSVSASVHTDRHGDAAAVITRYAADSAAAALDAALTDAAVWCNAQRGARRPIALDTLEPIWELKAMVRRLALRIDQACGVELDTLEPIWELKAMVRRLALRIDQACGVDADVHAATELLCGLGDS